MAVMESLLFFLPIKQQAAVAVELLLIKQEKMVVQAVELIPMELPLRRLARESAVKVLQVHKHKYLLLITLVLAVEKEKSAEPIQQDMAAMA